MQGTAILLKPVSENEIAEVAKLAKVIWQQHYPSIIGQQQVDYMLAHLYNYESLLKQLKEMGQQFYFITYQETVIGFIAATQEEQGCWQINKFYVLETYIGKGIGSSVLGVLKKIILPKKISLNVNRDNYKSINFYFKNGFKIVGIAKIDIGNGFYYDDFVMMREEK